jgi:DNA-binding transcriptional LysR family regulator
MVGENLNDLVAFLTVARERNFTRAAVKLGVTPLALSYRISRSEKPLRVWLLPNVNRSVASIEQARIRSAASVR